MTDKVMTAQTRAWFSSDSRGPDDLAAPDADAINRMTFASNDMTRYGWSLIGEAMITVHIGNTDTLVANKVAALRCELTTVRAAAEMQATQIEAKISKLLAITYTAPAGAAADGVPQ